MLAVVLVILAGLVVIGTGRHRNWSIDRHIKKENKCHIFKHLHSTSTFFQSYKSLCFKISDKTDSKFDLEIREALHIDWKKPNLKVQKKSFSSRPFTTVSVFLAPFFLSFFFFFFFFLFLLILFHLLFSVSLR